MEDKYSCLKLSNQLCFPLYACSKEIVRRYKPFLDKLDLTYTQYIAMMIMWEHKSVSVKDMGEYLYLDSGTLTPVLKTLEKKGYVERKRSSEDERVLVVSLTPEGDRLKERAVDIPYSMGNCLNISEEDASQLYVLLNRMLKSFENKK